jgi:phage shock protein A
MGFFDRISRLLRANVNDVVARAEDPERMLERFVMDLQEELVQLRQSVSSAIANQRRSEQQYEKAMQDFQKWHMTARSASDQGDEEMYRAAVTRAEEYFKTADSIKKNSDGQAEIVKALKKSLIEAEEEIFKMKTRKDFLKSRLQAAKSQEQRQQIVLRINQLMIDYQQAIDKSEATGLYWLETKLIIQTGLEQLEQTLEQAVANQTSLQRQYNQAIQYESDWQQQAQAAAERGDRDLLAAALEWKRTCNKTITSKKTQIDAQVITVELLKQYLILLESQMDECQSHIDTINTPTS